MSRTKIREVLKRHTDELMAVPGVVGVGEGDCEGMPCIIVFVVEKRSDVLMRIPNSLEGYLIKVEEGGEFRARIGPI
jgi:hypothetical protein